MSAVMSGIGGEPGGNAPAVQPQMGFGMPAGGYNPLQNTQTPQQTANTAIDTGGVTAPAVGVPGIGGGKSASVGQNTPMQSPGAQLGGGPVPVVDPNAVNPLGPQAQQSTMPQQNAPSLGGKSSGGKGGFNPSGNQGISQEQLQSFARSILNQ
jgi:hypothetical protein